MTLASDSVEESQSLQRSTRWYSLEMMVKYYGVRALKAGSLGHEPPGSRQTMSVIRMRVLLIPAMPAGNPSGLPFTRCELTPATFRSLYHRRSRRLHNQRQPRSERGLPSYQGAQAPQRGSRKPCGRASIWDFHPGARQTVGQSPAPYGPHTPQIPQITRGP